MMIDNTTKTRAIFEINKGTNKNPALDVNAKIEPEDRRIPFQNMIYIADGPSDIPSFSVVKDRGGKAYGVYNPDRPDEFAQNDRLRHSDRIDHYGRIVADREAAVAQRVARPPRHLNLTPEEEEARRQARLPRQATFLE